MITEDEKIAVNRCAQDLEKIKKSIASIEKDLFSQDIFAIQGATIAIASICLYMASDMGFTHVCKQLEAEIDAHNAKQVRH